MLSGWRTIWYFLWRGLGYGASLGAIAGTFIVPIIFTVIGLVWGAGVGLVSGLLLGIGVHFYNRRAYGQQLDFRDYQSNLVLGAGLATTFIAAILLATPLVISLAIPLVILLAPVAGLAAAYVTHRYAEDYAKHIIKRKNDDLLLDTRTHMEKIGTIEKFSAYFMARSKWIVIIGMVAILIASVRVAVIDSKLSGLTMLFGGITGWSFYVLILNTFVGFTNGMFIQMLNRVVFSPKWTKKQYKRWVMVSAGLFTLVTTPVVGLFFGAPILAIIAVLAARDYADWHFGYIEGDEIEKAKRDARYGRLSDETNIRREDKFFHESDEEEAYLWNEVD